jgi:hypothetical protein
MRVFLAAGLCLGIVTALVSLAGCGGRPTEPVTVSAKGVDRLPMAGKNNMKKPKIKIGR